MSVYHLSVLAGVSLSVLGIASHILVPPLLCVLRLSNQDKLLLRPLPALGLMFLTDCLHTHTRFETKPTED